MMLAHDDLLAISQLFDEKLMPINQRLDKAHQVKNEDLID